MSDETYFAVPPIAIPLDEQPLVVYGVQEDQRAKLQFSKDTINLSLGPVEEPVWTGTWATLIEKLLS